MHKKHARTSLVEPTNTSFVIFFFQRTFDYQGVDLQQHADLLWVVQEARMWFVFFLAMPSVKQILANYIII